MQELTPAPGRATAGAAEVLGRSSGSRPSSRKSVAAVERGFQAAMVQGGGKPNALAAPPDNARYVDVEDAARCGGGERENREAEARNAEGQARGLRGAAVPDARGRARFQDAEPRLRERAGEVRGTHEEATRSETGASNSSPARRRSASRCRVVRICRAAPTVRIGSESFCLGGLFAFAQGSDPSRSSSIRTRQFAVRARSPTSWACRRSP